MIGSPRAVRGLVRVGVWFLASTLVVALAAAQPSPSSQSRSNPSPTSPTVEVVFVGVAESPPLAQLVHETLTREGVVCRLSQAPVLREVDLLEGAPAPDDVGTRVWIDVVGDDLARLYFVDVGLGRYLMRDVPLRNGLDELGRERIAQVMETSTLALLSGESVMSRDQFERSLQALEATAKSDPEPDREPEPQIPPGRHLTRPAIGIAYQFYWSGPELDLLHGPALQVGLLRTLERGWFSATAVVAPSFPQVHQELGVEVRVRTTAVRLLFGRAWSTQQSWSWSARGGGGLSMSHISSRGIDEGWIEMPARTNVTPWLQAELGVNWELPRFVLSAAFSSQLSVVDTHYDHSRGTDRERLFTPWLLQPGAVVGVTWH